MRSLGARGAAAGALAGVAAAIWSLVLVEPVLQRAIDLEASGDGPVSRRVQSLVGLPVGTVLVGVALGLLFALVYRVVPSDAAPWSRSTGIALGAFVALGLVPQLVYPANPPGVGAPDTIGERTNGYLLAVLLGVVVVVASYAALRALARRGVSASVRQSAVVAGAVLAVAAGYAALPPSPDPVDAPASLVWQFRVLSLGGLALLHAVLGATFGLLSERALEAADHGRSHGDGVRVATRRADG